MPRIECVTLHDGQEITHINISRNVSYPSSLPYLIRVDGSIINIAGYPIYSLEYIIKNLHDIASPSNMSVGLKIIDAFEYCVNNGDSCNDTFQYDHYVSMMRNLPSIREEFICLCRDDYPLLPRVKQDDLVPKSSAICLHRKLLIDDVECEVCFGCGNGLGNNFHECRKIHYLKSYKVNMPIEDWKQLKELMDHLNSGNQLYLAHIQNKIIELLNANSNPLPKNKVITVKKNSKSINFDNLIMSAWEH